MKNETIEQFKVRAFNSQSKAFKGGKIATISAKTDSEKATRKKSPKKED